MSNARVRILSHLAPPAKLSTRSPHSLQNSRLTQGRRDVDPIGLFSCVSLLQNEPMIYGYARVSTDGQSEAAQVRQLRAAGAKKLFREVASGAKTDRPQLRWLLTEVGPGDVVMV